MRFHGITVALGVLALLFTGSALRAQSISMSYVTVGDPGNPTDPATGSLYGSVSYRYDIGEYDVTDSQYCTFLNAVDPTGANTLGLYSPQGDAEYGISFNAAGFNGSKYSVIRIHKHAGRGRGLLGYLEVCELDEQRGRKRKHGKRSLTLLGGTPIPQ